MPSKPPADPNAEREARTYANPIASRELILEVLEAAKGPVGRWQLAELLDIQGEEQEEGLRRRLNAMERDGQIIRNRKGAYGPVSKMDLVRGRVSGHRDGYGFVLVDGAGDDIYLANRQMRKVFDGDEVLVRISGIDFKGRKEGAIVEVLKHNTTQVVGRFSPTSKGGRLIPDNPRIVNDIFILAEDSANAQPGQFVSVEITRQPDRFGSAEGRVVEVLGDHMAPGMEIDVAIRAHDIPHIWPAAVEQEAAGFTTEVKEADKANRVDLRDLSLVTIDGEDARDFDDAVFCEKKRSGGWRLFVAIADVSHYVKPNSALDKEAQQRGNSVYFPDHVVPMLPKVLSNGLCSLNPAVDRLCMVCEMTISAVGRISGYKFYEALMHSKARLTYTKVGQMIADKGKKRSPIRKEYEHVAPVIDELHELYLAFRSQRTIRGAIDFETVETRIEFDSNRKIERIVPVHRNDAHKLIEECMLAANVCAARFLEADKIPALYRVHDSPKEQKLENLITFLGAQGLQIRMDKQGKVTPASYQEVMAQLEGRSDANIIQTVMLRSMNQAVYQPDNKGHFGLAFPAYTHFTSPIRRYPDLLVHRAIRSAIRNGEENSRIQRADGTPIEPTAKHYPYNVNDIQQLGEQCSMTERRADEATRDVMSWLKCEFLQNHIGEEFEGIVSAVTGFGLFVELKDLYVEGLVHITNLPQDYYHFEPAHHHLVGERTRKVFALGDPLVVRVVNVNLDERKVDFELQERKPRKRKVKGIESSAQAATKVSATKKDATTKSRSNKKVPAKKTPAKKIAAPKKLVTSKKSAAPSMLDAPKKPAVRKRAIAPAKEVAVIEEQKASNTTTQEAAAKKATTKKSTAKKPSTNKASDKKSTKKSPKTTGVKAKHAKKVAKTAKPKASKIKKAKTPAKVTPKTS